MTDTSWMPEPADVQKLCEASQASRHSARVSTRGKTEVVAARTAISIEIDAGKTQIPDLRQESFVVANLGDRICSLAACNAEDSSADIVCAAGIAAQSAPHIPCEESEGESSIQIWTLHAGGGGTFEFEVAHEGVKTEALEWCPSRIAFPAPLNHPSSSDSRVGLLLAVCGNATVCIWAIPRQADALKPPEPGTCALQECSSAAGCCPCSDAVPHLRSCHMCVVHSSNSVMYKRGQLLSDDQKRLTLRPKVTITKAQLASQAPSAVAWSPHPPCCQVLVGTANGNVAIMHLHGADSPSPPSASPVSIVHIGGSMIRCLAWCPRISSVSHEDGATTCFAVGAGQGQIALFDSAEPQTPVMDFSLGGTGAPSYAPVQHTSLSRAYCSTRTHMHAKSHSACLLFLTNPGGCMYEPFVHLAYYPSKNKLHPC